MSLILNFCVNFLTFYYFSFPIYNTSKPKFSRPTPKQSHSQTILPIPIPNINGSIMFQHKTLQIRKQLLTKPLNPELIQLLPACTNVFSETKPNNRCQQLITLFQKQSKPKDTFRQLKQIHLRVSSSSYNRSKRLKAGRRPPNDNKSSKPAFYIHESYRIRQRYGDSFNETVQIQPRRYSFLTKLEL